jgi:hypothetical protein
VPVIARTTFVPVQQRIDLSRGLDVDEVPFAGQHVQGGAGDSVAQFGSAGDGHRRIVFAVDDRRRHGDLAEAVANIEGKRRFGQAEVPGLVATGNHVHHPRPQVRVGSPGERRSHSLRSDLTKRMRPDVGALALDCPAHLVRQAGE